MLEPGDPGGPCAQPGSPFGRGEDHHRGPVADRRAVVGPQRLGDVRPADEFLGGDLTGHLRPRVRYRRGAAARGHLRHFLLTPAPGVNAQPGLQRGDAHRVRPQRREQVRIELEGQHAPEVPGRGLAEAVGEGDVSVSGADLHPGFVEGPGAVHLHMRFHDRREGPDRVDRLDERERPAGQVIRGARAPEPDVALGQPGARQHLGEDRHQHLHSAGGAVATADARGLGEAHDGDIGHGWRPFTGGPSR